jgi:hypothetical protein
LGDAFFRGAGPAWRAICGQVVLNSPEFSRHSLRLNLLVVTSTGSGRALSASTEALSVLGAANTNA